MELLKSNEKIGSKKGMKCNGEAKYMHNTEMT